MKYTEGFRTVKTNDGKMEVYVAGPVESSEGRFPVIIVLQEAFGVNSHIRDVCHRFAQEGYIAVSPELFHRAGAHVEVDYTDRKSMMPLLSTMNKEMFLEDLEATMKLVRSFKHADAAKIATIGFCMGGYVSVLAATRFELAGSVSFYGAGLAHPREGIQFGPLLEEFTDLRTPLLLHFGDEDQSIPLKEVDEVTERLRKLEKDFEHHIYANSNHGFFCDQRKSYKAESAEEAWKITLKWLQRRLHEKNSL